MRNLATISSVRVNDGARRRVLGHSFSWKRVSNAWNSMCSVRSSCTVACRLRRLCSDDARRLSSRVRDRWTLEPNTSYSGTGQEWLGSDSTRLDTHFWWDGPAERIVHRRKGGCEDRGCALRTRGEGGGGEWPVPWSIGGGQLVKSALIIGDVPSSLPCGDTCARTRTNWPAVAGN